MKKILVADDDLTSRTLLAEVARREGFISIEASSGERAWNILCDNADIEGLVTDMMMPDMSGDQLVQLLRGTAQYRELPIIMVSAVVSLKEVSHILELGASRFLSKPVNTEHLREYLATLTQRPTATR